MKSSNLAWRIELFDEPGDVQPAQPTMEMPRSEAPERIRPSPRFERRTIEIRDQGFVPFRIR